MSSVTVHRRMKRLVVMQRFEVRVSSGDCPIFWVQRNGTLEMGNRLNDLTPLRVSDREHVKGMVIVRIFIPNQAKVSNSLIVPATVQRERGSVEAFL